jgi:hypothetical protein
MGDRAEALGGWPTVRNLPEMRRDESQTPQTKMLAQSARIPQRAVIRA